jgi:hypothetical protein
VDKSKEFAKAPVADGKRDIGRLIDKFCLNEKIQKEELLDYFQIYADLNDKKRALIHKVNDYLNKYYDFRYNVVIGGIEMKRKIDKEFKVLDDRLYWTLFSELEFKNMPIGENRFRALLTSEDFSGSYHPFKEYIYSLPEWDGKTDYLKEYISQVELEDESKRAYLEECWKRWSIAAVCGWCEDIPSPYYVNQTCIVFYSGQAKQKTTFFSTLVPDELKMQYYKVGFSELNRNDKEADLPLATKMIINLDEMEQYNKPELGEFKSKVTLAQISLRKAYGRMETNLKRRASFVGSLNKEEFLTDVTGTRRFLTFTIKYINIKDFDINKCWAQAYALWKRGERYWFNTSEIEVIEKENSRYKSNSMIAEMLLRYYRLPTEEDSFMNSTKFLTATDIADNFAKLQPRLNLNNSVVREIGICLKEQGYQKEMKRMNGKPVYVWNVCPVEGRKLENMDGSEVKDTPI